MAPLLLAGTLMLVLGVSSGAAEVPQPAPDTTSMRKQLTELQGGKYVALRKAVLQRPDALTKLEEGRQRAEAWQDALLCEALVFRLRNPKDARLMERFLRDAGVKTRSVFTHEGHSFAAWRRLAAEVLVHFFPAAGRGRSSDSDPPGLTAPDRARGGT